jgi:hypothetical protein
MTDRTSGSSMCSCPWHRMSRVWCAGGPWWLAGAARITVRQVVAGGRAVPMTFTPAGGPATTLATQGPLTLAGPGTLSVDLRGVSSEGDARKTLLVDLQIQTLLRSPGFEPVGATPFGFNMAVSLP